MNALSILNIRSLADLRALLYVLLPVMSTLLVSQGVLDDNQASLWSGLATAILGPVIAAVNAKDVSSGRTAFYAVFAAVQALVVGYGLVTAEQVGVWVPIISAIVGLSTGGVAAANTNTTPAE